MKWEDPPPDSKVVPGVRRFAAEAAELRANPERWGLVIVLSGEKMRNGPGMASAMRTGNYGAFKPSGAFETKSRKVTENGVTVVKIYARYIGASLPG